jgi:uncharacterized membrane protein
MFEPLITNDAAVFGLLITILGALFYTADSSSAFFKLFYTFIPLLLLAYFLPAIMTSLGVIAESWYDSDSAIKFLQNLGYDVDTSNYASKLRELVREKTIPEADVAHLVKHSKLYFVASRYLLPASLILLTLSTDLKAIFSLGPKALIMFFTATVGIVIGGPIALWIVSQLEPSLLASKGEDSVWRGLATVAGSWIGGGANQAAMKEIYRSGNTLYGAMLIVDIFVANLWMAFLLYGAGRSERMDKWLKADNSSITALTAKVSSYQAQVTRVPSFKDIVVLMAIVFAIVGVSHLLADVISAQMSAFLKMKWGSMIDGVYVIDPKSKWHYAASLGSGFFWLIVFATSFGLIASFTKARSYEGAGASKFGSLFIYILVVTIGMKMNLVELYYNWGEYKSFILIGIIWMLVHVSTLLIVAKIIRAPFFFVAVGSQANVGGAASAPIVASAFNPALATVGVLLAVLGYALGTFAAIACALMMQGISAPDILP